MAGGSVGKNGATCWLAGAVRTLQKRVDWLEAKDSFKNVKDGWARGWRGRERGRGVGG